MYKNEMKGIILLYREIRKYRKAMTLYLILFLMRLLVATHNF